MSRLCSSSQVPYHFIRALLLSSKSRNLQEEWSWINTAVYHYVQNNFDDCLSVPKGVKWYVIFVQTLSSPPWHLSHQKTCQFHKIPRNTPFLSISGKPVTQRRATKSLQYTFLLSSLYGVLYLFPGVWYHGSIPSRLHLECCSAESWTRQPQILILFVVSAVHGDFGKEVSSSALSVLINPKDPHAVQLGQLGDEYGE